MTLLQKLIEQEFNQIKNEAGSTKSISKLREENFNFKEKISDLEERITYLALYQRRNGEFDYIYEALRRVISLFLLKNQLMLSDIPQESRMNCLETDGYFSVAAHRCASDSNNVAYLTGVLSMMYEDAIYGVLNDIITFREFYELICQWLNYFSYDKIELKGDKNFERYFQEQKERHRELFEAFGL